MIADAFRMLKSEAENRGARQPPRETAMIVWLTRAWLRRRGSHGIGAALTLGSPHQGTWSARFGIGRNVGQLQPGSAWLATLADSEAPATRSLFTLILSLHDNIVVPQTAQTLDGAAHRVFAGLGHMELLRHRVVRSHLAAALDQAARTHEP